MTMGRIVRIGEGARFRGRSGPARQVRAQDVQQLRLTNHPWLDRYNLRLTGIEEIDLVAEPRNIRAVMGKVGDEMRPDLELAAAVSAVGPVFWGRGGAGVPDQSWDKAARKRLVDGAAASVQARAFDALLGLPHNHTLSLITRASEGSRPKPGRADEIGGNPAIYLGERFGVGELELSLVIDCVDKTGATVEGGSAGHSAVTAFLVSRSSNVNPIPDSRMLKLVSGYGFEPSITDIDASSEVVARALAAAAGVPADKLWVMNLLIGREKRLQEPTDAFRAHGVNFVTEKDGDVMPAVAAALRAHDLMIDGQVEPAALHGMLAAAGGAAEGGLLLPVEWLGGEVVLGFASAGGFKTWDARRGYVGSEEADIREAGFDPFGTISMQDIYAEPFADGVAVFGGISQKNLWIPELTGPEVRDDGIRVAALSIAADGTARVRIFEFETINTNSGVTAARFMPRMLSLRQMPNARDVELTIHSIMQRGTDSDRQQLWREFAQEYYSVLRDERGGFRVDTDAFAALKASGRFDEKDELILRAFRKVTPWLV